jgi:tetratricopeptide (TPR) repeat protein
VGRERTWKGKHLYFCLACLMALTACATVNGMLQKKNVDAHVQAGRALMEKRDFQGALKEFDLAVAKSPGVTPSDEALYYSALVLVHYDNPKKDYAKALKTFKSIVRIIPKAAMPRRPLYGRECLE